eukprot:scaffold162476_cov35-Attheya_sp.AAC.1
MTAALPVMYIHWLYRATTSDHIVNSTVQNDAPSHRTDIPSGGDPSFATHTPIHHAEGTTADVANPQREFVSDDIYLIIQHDATLPRTDNQTGGGTFSLVSHTPKYYIEGTTADVANPRRESV